MLQPHEFDLLQRSVDGELTTGERTALETLLARSEEARHVAAALAALDAGGDEPSTEPPGDAVPAIIKAIQALPPHHQHLSLAWSQDSAPSSRPAMPAAASSFSRRAALSWGMSAAAVIVLAGLWISGALQQSPAGVDATIGAARGADAPSGGDRTPASDEAVVRFLRSDEGRQLLQDPAARRTLAQAELHPLLASAELRDALPEPAFADVILATATDPTLADLLTQSDATAAPRDPGVDAALARARVRAALTRPAIRTAMASREFRAALRSDRVRALLAGEDAQAMLRSQAFAAATLHDSFRAALAHPDFIAALARTN